jgi:putative phosphoribosyl transferase
LRVQAELRAGLPRVPVAGRTALVVDDGVATGSTARAACQVVREQGARFVVLATPVAPPEVYGRFRGVADDVVCVATPADFLGVGQFYRDFAATPDEEVTSLLHAARMS